MKTALKTAAILSWFNIIFWGLIDGILLLNGLVSFNMPILAVAVLLSAVPLNCYAALKLHASIRNPNQPLSHQTPVGIRFVGFVALFFGTGWISEGVMLLKNGVETQAALNEQIAQVSKAMQQLPQATAFKHLSESNVAHGFGIVSIVLGLFVVVNVVLNLRLLRWYYLVRKSGVS
jgi:hypothetical protein